MAGSCMSLLPQHIENSGQELLLPVVVERSMSQCKVPHFQILSIRPRSCLSEGSRYTCLAIGKPAVPCICGGGEPAVWVFRGVSRSGRSD